MSHALAGIPRAVSIRLHASAAVQADSAASRTPALGVQPCRRRCVGAAAAGARRCCRDPRRSPGRPAFMLSLTLPRSSKPSTLTFTWSPTLTTSLVLPTRCGASSLIWTSPSRRRGSSRRRRNRRPSRPCRCRSRRSPARRRCRGSSRSPPARRSASTAATLIVPSSSMSILAPVTSAISRITLPPEPITSRILSLGMVIVVMRGALSLTVLARAGQRLGHLAEDVQRGRPAPGPARSA